jgi:hypothetical protein
VNSVELFHVHKQMENTKIIGISANPWYLSYSGHRDL